MSRIRIHSYLLCCLTAAFALLFSGSVHAQLSDVTQPGDPIIPSSANSPGSEAVANAIDNQPTKYLNFDSGRGGFLPSGFVVSPSVGVTHVTGLSMQSANDAPERDPKTITLEGSNDATVGGTNSGNWTLITTISNIPPYTARFQTQRFFFSNPRPYRHYRWLVTETQTTPNGCCMQIAEVELLGTTLPSDVTQPGDTIFASSANSPGSEAVANAIDGQPTKYLNFDSGRGGFLPSGFAVSPSIGRTLVNAISMQSANDAPERDPKTITLEGSNDPTLTGYNSGTWELITTISGIPAYTGRFQTQTFFFDNPKPYRHYRWVTTETQTTPNGCCMQIAEVELLGSGAPKDVTQPGDPIIPSSANSPGSEAVANAIDDQPTKYLNFDSGRGGFLPSGFVVSPRVGPTTLVGLTMQSANDGPERDPKAITLEGSNDDTISGFNSGTWTLITAISNIPPYTARFQTKEFFFLNGASFKHYRWIVTETQTTPNGCCMQIAEVEFLAVPQAGNTNVIDTLIRRQPLDTPVLLGSQATFRVLLTGPWNVQWYKNGLRIPGATAASYTTPAATQPDDGSLFKAVVSSSDGTQVSDEVMLSIFTPSATESIAVSWRGSGANGAPTDMLASDITGFQPQAYWNNLSGGSGTLATPLNSGNVANPTITITWATSGEWGAGTGNQDPTERMFNGMATSFSTTEAAAQTVTLSGVPAGNHSVFLYTVQVPLEFFNVDFAVVTHDSGGNDVVQRRYIRPLNADEYNPTPGFSLVTSDTAASRGVGNFMRFDNVQPGPDGIIQVRFFSPGRVDLPGGDPIRGPGLNGLQLVLSPPPAGEPPVITKQPASANGIAGGCITLSVEATGPGLSYQWLKNGQEIAGATGSSLTLAGLTAGSAGSYIVVVSNPAGRVRSRTAVVDVLASGQIPLGLITYFKLDDGGADGFTAANSAAGGQAGRINGSIAGFTPGQIGNGLVFNGSDNYVLVPNYPKVSRAITVAGWTQPLSGPLVNNWVEGQTTGASGQFLLDLIDDNGVLTVRAQIEVGPNRVLVTAPLDVNQSDVFIWHHFAMSANGVSLSIYWDGVLLNTVDYLGSINSTASLPWLAIGANLDALLAPVLPTFSGNLDEVALWSRSLSGVEIQGLYNGGLSGQSIVQVPPVLVAGDCRPTINCPNNITAECTGGLTPVTYTVTGADATGVPLPATCVPPSGTGFRVGTSNVICTVTAGPGNTASCSFRVTVVDTTPPTVTCPGNITADATSPAGAVVNYVASAQDPCGIASFNCAPVPGSTFPIGQTSVVCSSVDNAGNSNACTFSVTVRAIQTNQPPTAVISSEQLINLGGEFEYPVLISCNWWNACLVANGWSSTDPEHGDLTYQWFLEPGATAIGAGPVITNCLEVGEHTIILVVTDPGGLTGTTNLTIEVVTAPLAIEVLIEQINESHKSGYVLSRKIKRELTETLRVALGFAGQEKLRETLKALDVFEKKVRAQVSRPYPELAEAWIRYSQLVSEGMEHCIKPPRKHKDEDPKDPDPKHPRK